MIRHYVFALASALYLIVQPLGAVGILIGLAWVPQVLDLSLSAVEDVVLLPLSAILSLLPALLASFFLHRRGAKGLSIAPVVLSLVNVLLGIALLFGFRTCAPC